MVTQKWRWDAMNPCDQFVIIRRYDHEFRIILIVASVHLNRDSSHINRYTKRNSSPASVLFNRLQKGGSYRFDPYVFFILCLFPYNSSAYGPILIIFFLFERGRCPGGPILHCINISPILCLLWLIINIIVT